MVFPDGLKMFVISYDTDASPEVAGLTDAVSVIVVPETEEVMTGTAVMSNPLACD